MHISNEFGFHVVRQPTFPLVDVLQIVQNHDISITCRFSHLELNNMTHLLIKYIIGPCRVLLFTFLAGNMILTDDFIPANQMDTMKNPYHMTTSISKCETKR